MFKPIMEKRIIVKGGSLHLVDMKGETLCTTSVNMYVTNEKDDITERLDSYDIYNLIKQEFQIDTYTLKEEIRQEVLSEMNVLAGIIAKSNGGKE